MTWPMVPLPMAVRAILLLPAGMRAFDDDFAVPFPAPCCVEGPGGGRFERVHLHTAGLVDSDWRALYVLGGRYLPQGAGAGRYAPDEVYDQ